MKKYLEQLRPQERRWVVGIAFVVFVMLNYLLVWPHFKDWNLNELRMKRANDKMAQFRPTVAHQREYQSGINYLLQTGDPVPKEDQAQQLDFFYRSRANENNVQIISNNRMRSSSDDFFTEQEVLLNTLSTESNLVSFLYSLGSSNSMVRVRAMSLRPDTPHHLLSANITIVASYVKNQTNAPARTAAPAPKPAVTTPAAKSPAPTTTPSKTAPVKTNTAQPSGRTGTPPPSKTAPNKSPNLKD